MYTVFALRNTVRVFLMMMYLWFVRSKTFIEVISELNQLTWLTDRLGGSDYVYR